VMAAGFQPVRLTGDPGAATPAGDRYLGPTVDGDRRSQFQLLLDGAYGDLDGVVIARDGENFVRLFYALRALRKMASPEAAKVPPLHFYDLLHMQRPASAHYNRVRTQQLGEVLGRWSGKAVEDDALRGAIAACNENRTRLAALERLRTGDAIRLSGTEALQLAITSRLMPKAEHSALVERITAQANGRPAIAGKRVFVTGSGHDHTAFYELVEGLGAVIVGDDHEWGDRSFAGLVDETTTDPIQALSERYHRAPPIGAKYSVAERAAYTADRARRAGAQGVIAYIKTGDPGPRWDVPAQRAALGDVPLLMLDDQGYGLDSPDALKASVTAFVEIL